MTIEHLDREHTRTLQQIFQHPMTHNLEWRHVVTLLDAIGTVTEEPNSSYRVTVNEQTYSLHRPRHKDLADAEELIALRHFLEQAGVAPDGTHDKGDPGDDTSTHPGRD